MVKKQYVRPCIEIFKFSNTDLDLFYEDVREDNLNDNSNTDG